MLWQKCSELIFFEKFLLLFHFPSKIGKKCKSSTTFIRFYSRTGHTHIEHFAYHAVLMSVLYVRKERQAQRRARHSKRITRNDLPHHPPCPPPPHYLQQKEILK